MEVLENRKIRNPLILGGSGYLGSQIIWELYNRNTGMQALRNRSPLPAHFGIAEHRGSLDDFDWRKLESNLPDVIIHVARMAGRNERSRKKAALQNAEANRKLLSWLQSLETPPLLVFASGTLVYGSRGSEPIDETASLNPISFQRAYHLAEIPILEALQQKELPIAIVRPAWIYGSAKWYQAFFQNYMRRKKRVPYYGNGENLMSMVHVSDAARMILKVAEQGPAYKIYNLAVGEIIRQKDLAEELATASGLDLKRVPLWWLRLRFDRAVAEAFEFSLVVKTLHQELWQDFEPRYKSVRDWIAEQEF